jgi:hypothetical protein
MDIREVFGVIHLIGFALGLGGASISDVMFFRAIGDKKVSAEELGTLRVLSRVIWVGITLLILSGVGFLTVMYLDNNGSIPILSSPKFQMKLTLVAIVVANGFVFLKVVFDKIRQIGIAPFVNNSTIWLLAVTGTVSFVSWYGILAMVSLPRTFRPPYILLLGTYLIIVFIGSLVSRTMLKHKLGK